MPQARFRSRSALIVLGCLVLCLVAARLPARADAASVVIATRSQYMPGDDRNVPGVLVHGNDLLFVNLDQFSFGGHSLTSETPGLFDSGVVEIRQSATIPMATLPAGTYGFYCTVHLEMKGQLVII